MEINKKTPRASDSILSSSSGPGNGEKAIIDETVKTYQKRLRSSFPLHNFRTVFQREEIEKKADEEMNKIYQEVNQDLLRVSRPNTKRKYSEVVKDLDAACEKVTFDVLTKNHANKEITQSFYRHIQQFFLKHHEDFMQQLLSEGVYIRQEILKLSDDLLEDLCAHHIDTSSPIYQEELAKTKEMGKKNYLEKKLMNLKNQPTPSSSSTSTSLRSNSVSGGRGDTTRK